MTKLFNLPLVITGRLAVLKKSIIPVLNVDSKPRFFSGKNPVDFDAKLKGYAWELVTSKKTGKKSTTSRYFLAAAPHTQIDPKYVSTVRNPETGKVERYADFDVKTSANIGGTEVQDLKEFKGRQAMTFKVRILVKLIKSIIALLKDKKNRPVGQADCVKSLNYISPYLNELIALLNGEHFSRKESDFSLM